MDLMDQDLMDLMDFMDLKHIVVQKIIKNYYLLKNLNKN